MDAYVRLDSEEKPKTQGKTRHIIICQGGRCIYKTQWGCSNDHNSNRYTYREYLPVCMK